MAFAAWWKEMSAGNDGNSILEMESCCLPLFRLEYRIKLTSSTFSMLG